MAPQSNEASASPRVMTRTYEIQRFAGGRWLLDSVADDRKVAIEMATALMKSGRAPAGVQVMSVQQASDGQFSEVRVYRATPNDQPAAEAQPKGPVPGSKSDAKTPHEVGDFKHDGRGDTPNKGKKKSKGILFSLKIAFGVGLAAAATEAAHLILR